MSKKRNYIGLPLLALVMAPTIATAQVAGVGPLLKQAQYWVSKGRQDLARQAYSRVLAIDPNNQEARRGLAGNAPKPAAKAPATAARPAAPAPVAARTAAPTRATPAPATTAPRSVDRGGNARAAGFAALEKDQLDTAVARFRTAIAANSNDADALGGLGIARLRKSQFAEARDLLTKASRLGDADKWAEALKAARFYADLETAKSALGKGDLAKAETIASTLMQSDFQDRASAVSVLAGVYEKQGRYNDAAQLYSQLGQSTGGAQGNVVRNQARAAMQTGNDVQAEQLLRSAIGTTPSDPWVVYDLADLLRKQGRVAEIDALVRQLAYSDQAEPLYAAALILDQSGRTSDAQAVASRIPEGKRTSEMRNFISGLSVGAQIEQAKALGKRGAQAQGLALLQQTAEKRGLSADRMGAIAQGMLDLGDPRSAAQLAMQAVNAPANDAAAYDPAIRVLAATGQDGLAMEALQKATGMAGSSLEDQRSLGDLKAALAASQADRLRLSGQLAPAFDILQEAWSNAPGNTDVLGALARLYQTGGMNAQAAQTYRLLLAQKADDKGAVIGLIDTANAAGDTASARAAVNQALRQFPQDYEVYLAAARMAQSRGNDKEAVRYLKAARTLYMQANGTAPGAILASGNPFVSTSQSNNPFLNRPVQRPAAVNPFQLGSNPSAMQMEYSAAPNQAAYAQPASYAGRGQAQAFGAMPGTMQAQPMGFNAAPNAGGALPGTMPMGAAGLGAPSLYGYENAAGSNFGTGDPVLDEINGKIYESSADSGPRADVETGYRSRSGETGLSKLRELSGTGRFSTTFAGGRIGATAQAIVLDSGRPTGSGLARFGVNPIPEATAIVLEEKSQLAQSGTQHASGVALSASYVNSLLKLEVGTTPLGFEKQHVTGRVEVTPRLSEHSTARVWADRKAVTDSVISYAGASYQFSGNFWAPLVGTNPVPKVFWGSVMKSGGGASWSYDKNGNGVYADASYYHYDGTAVRDNSSVEVNVGGYLRAWQDSDSSITVGFNANFQDYANNQNYFTYGHGGYFSPQSFLSVNFPVRYRANKGPLAIEASVAPGYQSYDQQEEAVFPTDPTAQGLLDYLKSVNGDARARYDSLSKTGFGMMAGGSLYYQVSPNTKVGGELNLNTFGQYKEFRSLIGVKQTLGGN